VQEFLEIAVAALKVLMLVAENGGPTMFTRIGMLRALIVGRARPAKEGREEYRIVR